MNFSILISLYYKENPIFLKECLDSLKNQTLQTSEIIVVFDGKITNDLEQMIETYKNQLPIKIIQLPENLGLGKALNEGLKHCTNKWVFRMDTDDICLPKRFEKQIKFIKENPEVVLFSSHIAEFDKDPKEISGYRKVPIDFQSIQKYSLKRSPFNHMTIAFKKSVIEEVGGYQHHLFLEDYNLWLRVIAKKYKVGNIDEVLLLARAGEGMIKRRRGLQYIKSEWKLFKLKQQLQLQNYPQGFLVFLLRVIPRILPIKILQWIYKFLRKNN